MATFVLKDAHVLIGGVDLSDHCTQVTINYSAELLEDTAMSSTFTRSRTTGLLDWSMEFIFWQDFDSASVDATLFPLVGAAAATAMIVRAVKATAIGPTNPEFQGNARIESYSPIAGSMAEVASTTVPFLGEGALTRATV